MWIMEYYGGQHEYFQVAYSLQSLINEYNLAMMTVNHQFD